MRHERITGNGAVLTDSQIKSMLEGKKTLVKGLKRKKGSYDAKGLQYKVKLEFPKKEK